MSLKQLSNIRATYKEPGTVCLRFLISSCGFAHIQEAERWSLAACTALGDGGAGPRTEHKAAEAEKCGL